MIPLLRASTNSMDGKEFSKGKKSSSMISFGIVNEFLIRRVGIFD
jgi:hypothetical protein